jgi:hypothetical protein
MKISIVKWLVSPWRKRKERLERAEANRKRWERLLGLADDETGWRALDEDALGHTSDRPEVYLLPEPRDYRDSGHSGGSPRLKG